MGRRLSRVRHYSCLRKLLLIGPWKSGMGRGLRPSAVCTYSDGRMDAGGHIPFDRFQHVNKSADSRPREVKSQLRAWKSHLWRPRR